MSGFSENRRSVYLMESGILLIKCRVDNRTPSHFNYEHSSIYALFNFVKQVLDPRFSLFYPSTRCFLARLNLRLLSSILCNFPQDNGICGLCQVLSSVLCSLASLHNAYENRVCLPFVELCMGLVEQRSTVLSDDNFSILKPALFEQFESKHMQRILVKSLEHRLELETLVKDPLAVLLLLVPKLSEVLRAHPNGLHVARAQCPGLHVCAQTTVSFLEADDVARAELADRTDKADSVGVEAHLD